jgi:hypothetical protein
LALLAPLLGGPDITQASPSVSISTVDGTKYTTDDVFGFKTTGAMMAGTTVTVCNEGGSCETKAWVETGAAAGGATGTGWSLALDGDSFDTQTAAFVFKTSASIRSFMMDGRPGKTTFDIVTSEKLSPGSELGFPFTFVSSNPSMDDGQIGVLYSDALGVSDKFYGDLFLTMTVTFGTAFSGELQFQTDTDNTGVIRQVDPNPVPEPATLTLVASGLLGVAACRRRQRRL